MIIIQGFIVLIYLRNQIIKLKKSIEFAIMRKQSAYIETSDILLTPAPLFRTHQSRPSLQKDLLGLDKKKVRFEMLEEKRQGDFDQDDKSNSNSNMSRLSCSEVEISSSHIIKNFPDLKALLDLNVGSYILRKLFKASQHNFDVKKFHQLCDGFENTVVIAEISNGNIVGGFTPISWNDEYEKNKTHYKTDKLQKSFVFNYTSKQKYPIISNTNNKAIVGCQYLGPTFGGGYDFSIGNFANKRYSSSCDFPTSYSKTTESKNIKLTRRSLIGVSEELFLIKEWEVFQIFLKNKTITTQQPQLKQYKQSSNRLSQDLQPTHDQKGYWNDVIGFFTGAYKNKE